jgi:hypothetical protein
MPLSAMDPIGQSFQRVGIVLFRPFQWRRYAAIAVGGWLTMLGAGGGNFNGFNGGGGRSSGPGPGGPGGGAPAPTPADILQKVFTWIGDHLVLVIVIAFVVILFLFAIYLLYRWLNARGEFMLLDSTIRAPESVKEQFGAHKELANNLFKFFIYWDLAVFNYFLLGLLAGILLILPDFNPMFAGNPYRFSGWTLTAIILVVLVVLLSIPLLWFFRNLLYHVAIPLMYVRNINAWPAFKMAYANVVRPNLGQSLLFFLMQTVAAIAEGIGSTIGMFAVFIATCCLAAALSMIPLIGSVVLYAGALTALPAMIFQRAYSLLFLSRLGPDYQVAWHAVVPTGFPVDPLAPPPAPDVFPPAPGDL